MKQSDDWGKDWTPITDRDDAARMEQELRRELSPGHVLHGVTATAIGRRQGRADRLFLLPDGRVAQVHLTWQAESDPRWPSTEIYPGLDAWRGVPPEDR
ncbi:MAG: hypothetical protein Q4G26_00625 [Paracoccus sp. (in: a-proteobacteria)]|nr:hypothetical protein [Paracoccus sp. (in: a-proteobacteria)]